MAAALRDPSGGAAAVSGSFVRPRVVADPQVRLVVIHHAGGSAAAYFPLSRLLPQDWELLLLDLPGRGKSHTQPPLADMERLAEWAAARVRPWAEGAPLALFGHSLGAVVAHETARLLEAEGTPPAWLGVSGRAAPGLTVTGGLPDTDLPDDELMRRLTAMGGMHPRIDELPDFRARFLHLVRNDLRAVAGYRAEPASPPLGVPLTVFGGSEDHVAPPGTLVGWVAETLSRYERVTVAGGHFHFLGQAFPDFADLLVQEIRQALPAATRRRTYQLGPV